VVIARRTAANTWKVLSRLASAGSASNVTGYRSVGSFVAPLTSGESSDLTTLNVQPLTANGDMIYGHVRAESGNEASEACTPRVLVNGTIVSQGSIATNTRAFGMMFALERMSDTQLRCWIMFGNEIATNINSGVWEDITVSSLSAGCTLSIRNHRGAVQTKSVTYRRLSAQVQRA